MTTQHETQRNGKLKFKANWVLAGFLAIAGFFLIAEHKAHVLLFLPFVLLLACPLMHVFMHRGHGDHDDHQHRHGPPGNKS
jgi:hypothetical protein